MLLNWIQHWREKIHSDETMDELMRSTKLRTIYRFSFLEIIRQVSVHCIERGELLHDVLQKYIDLSLK